MLVKNANRYAKKLLISIGKLSAAMASEVFKRHSVDKNYLEFYSKKDANWLMNELGMVNKLVDGVHNTCTLRLMASEYFRLYITKHYKFGKITPGDRVGSFLDTEKLIATYILGSKDIDTDNPGLPDNQRRVIRRISELEKSGSVLDIRASIKHSEVFITVYLNPNK